MWENIKNSLYNPGFVIICLVYFLVFFFYRMETYDEFRIFIPIASDAGFIAERVQENLCLPFEEKSYHSWGPFSFIFVEFLLILVGKTCYNVGDLTVFQFYQYAQFIFGFLALIFSALLLNRIGLSRIIQFLLIINLLLLSSFISYTINLHPDLFLLFFTTAGTYFGYLFFQTESSSKKFYFLALLCFMLGYFTKRAPIVFMLVTLFLPFLFDRKLLSRLWDTALITIFLLLFITVFSHDFDKAYSPGELLGQFTDQSSNFFYYPPYHWFIDTIHPLFLSFLTPVIALGSIPIVIYQAIFRRKYNKCLIFLVSLLISFFSLLMFYPSAGVSYVRYLLPVAPVILAIAGIFFRFLKERNFKLISKILTIALILSVALQVPYNFYINMWILAPKLTPEYVASAETAQIIKRSNIDEYKVGLDEYIHPVSLNSEKVKEFPLKNENYKEADIFILNNASRLYRYCRKSPPAKEFLEIRENVKAPESEFELIGFYEYPKFPWLWRIDPFFISPIEVYAKKGLFKRIDSSDESWFVKRLKCEI